MTSAMHESDASFQDLRPHLVMAVGNLVVGDSRVEKAAITARDLGYKVTVVGVRRRTVQQISFIDGDIPIIRPPVGSEHHSRVVDAVAKREERLVQRRRQINRLPQSLKRPAYLAHRSVFRSREAVVKASRRLGRSWRTLWPHLVDYESTFFDAFKALEPDVIHVHDRHPLPGAAKYARWAEQTADVRPVKWVYDAHEFVPTQHLPPPVEHQQAWMAVESECIQHADAVVTVTDKIAELIRRRHHLSEVPTVVRNLPSTHQAAQNTLRSDVRSAVGLAPEVPLAVYAGGITPQRGLATLLEAQYLIPELHVAVICKNDEERRRTLREQAEILGTQERLHLLDYVPAAHVSRFISTADVGISALLPSAAHQEAAPTKVSEYLHAYLPVVVSDMRAQAERVRRLGFGAIYPSGDAKAMAQVLAQVLQDASEYKEKITEEVILANSWEADVPALEAIWEKLSPSDRHRQLPAKLEPYVALLGAESGAQQVWRSAFEELGKRTDLCTSLPRLKEVSGDLTNGNFMLTDDGQRFLDFWRREVASVRGVFYEDPVTLVDGWTPALTTGILAMSGKPAIRMLVENVGFDVDRLRSIYPHHWLHEIPDREAHQLRSEFETLRESIRKNDRQVITSCLSSAFSLGNVGMFVPPPFVVNQWDDHPVRETMRLGWIANEKRSEEEKRALADLQSATEDGLGCIEIGGVDSSTNLTEFDIYIDTMSTDLPTANGLRALAAGCVLVTGISGKQSGRNEKDRAASFVGEMPQIHAAPDELQAIVLSLTQDRPSLTARRQNSIHFAERRLSPASVAEQLSSIFS